MFSCEFFEIVKNVHFEKRERLLLVVVGMNLQKMTKYIYLKLGYYVSLKKKTTERYLLL